MWFWFLKVATTEMHPAKTEYTHSSSSSFTATSLWHRSSYVMTNILQNIQKLKAKKWLWMKDTALVQLLELHETSSMQFVCRLQGQVPVTQARLTLRAGPPSYLTCQDKQLLWFCDSHYGKEQKITTSPCMPPVASVSICFHKSKQQ